MAMDKEREALVALDRHEVMVAYEYMKERNFPDIAACHVIQRAAAALSAPQQEPVAWAYFWPGITDPEIHRERLSNAGRLARETQGVVERPLVYGDTAPQPADGVVVPREFLRKFNTLAHNYSLEAIPPDYYEGREGDAFKDAYRRCGSDLAKLRDMLAAAKEPR